LRGSFITGLLMLAVSAVFAMVACGARTGLVPLPRDAGDTCNEPTTLQATIHACDGGQPTTISGTVYDPGAHDPLFNVVVYVPGTAVQPLSTGASCDSCSSLYTGHPIVTALTDATGRFVITNAPDGDNIPLVVQIGKWRRQFTIAKVTPCTENALPDRTLTLPKNHLEGDIPNIAVSTGGADTLECLLTRIGIDGSEYGPGANGPGRIHIFQGLSSMAGDRPDAAGVPALAAQCDAGVTLGTHAVPTAGPSTPLSYKALWDSTNDIMRYDLVLFSCEGAETANMNQQVLFDYAQAGGRVFASHYHYSWFNTGPFSAAANLADWTRGAVAIEPLVCNSTGTIGGQIITTLPNGQPFPGGQAMHDWLTTVGAEGSDGLVPLENARHNADLGPQSLATEWVASGPGSVYGTPPDDVPVSANGATLYMSFNTPIGAPAENQCGQVIFSDLHVSASAGDQPGTVVPGVAPGECANVELAPDEKILEFMLFNLSSCVQPEGLPPAPPPACGMGTDGGAGAGPDASGL
jgi:hypothetical protein